MRPIALAFIAATAFAGAAHAESGGGTRARDDGSQSVLYGRRLPRALAAEPETTGSITFGTGRTVDVVGTPQPIRPKYRGDYIRNTYGK